MQSNSALKEYLDVIFRRKWWIILPMIVATLLSIGFFFRMPKRYMAETRVQIQAQEISERVLRPVIDADPTNQVTQITSEITSQAYVQELDRKLSLVGTPGGPRDLTELGKRLEMFIDLKVNPRNRYFDLSVSWSDPKMAAAIANELANIYITRYSEMRRELARDLVDDLTANREQIEIELQEVRERIERFRADHRFELDSYAGENRQQFDRNVAEISRLDSEIRRLQDENESLRIDLRTPAAAMGGGGRGEDPRLARRAELRDEIGRYTSQGFLDSYAPLRRAKKELADLEAELKATSEGSDDEAPIGVDENARLRIRNQIANNERDIELFRQKITALEADNREIRARQQQTPLRQIELDRLVQLEERLAADYDEARNREAQAKGGRLVEELGRGESFEVLKMALPPGKPYWPDFKLFVFVGVAVGLGLGVSLVLLLEVFDQSFKSEEQLAASIDLPILAVIPDLNRVADQAGRRKQARKRGA